MYLKNSVFSLPALVITRDYFKYVSIIKMIFNKSQCFFRNRIDFRNTEAKITNVTVGKSTNFRRLNLAVWSSSKNKQLERRRKGIAANERPEKTRCLVNRGRSNANIALFRRSLSTNYNNIGLFTLRTNRLPMA